MSSHRVRCTAGTCLLAGLAWVASMAPTASPGAAPDRRDALTAILEGAPAGMSWVGEHHANGLPRYARIDYNKMTALYQADPDTNRHSASVFLHTWGQTPPQVRPSAGFTVSGDPHGARIDWKHGNADSSEDCILSRQMLVGHSDSTQTWFYIKFLRVVPAVSDLVLGIGDGFNPFTGNMGTPWEPGTWDGHLNDSHNGSIYFVIHGTGGLDSLTSVDLIAIGGGANFDTATIALATPVAVGSGLPIELAFHCFGLDSVQYYANGATGTMDLRAVWPALPGDESACLMMAQRHVLGSTLGCPVSIYEAWVATAPR